MIPAVIIILGIIYLTVGLWGIIALRPPFIDLTLALLATSILLSVLGILSLIVGVGIFRKKEWARRMWLSLSLVLVAFHACWLLKDIPLGIGISDVVELALIAALAGISWVKLSKKRRRALFEGTGQNIEPGG